MKQQQKLWLIACRSCNLYLC